jgi:hypothetical protein
MQYKLFWGQIEPNFNTTLEPGLSKIFFLSIHSALTHNHCLWHPIFDGLRLANWTILCENFNIYLKMNCKIHRYQKHGVTFKFICDLLLLLAVEYSIILFYGFLSDLLLLQFLRLEQ